MANYTIKEITEFLEQIESSKEPFYGETGQVWQNGEIVLWKALLTKKPKEGGDKKQNNY